jgi:cobalt-zinc-cadmium efflux system outer membrane protein
VNPFPPAPWLRGAAHALAALPALLAACHGYEPAPLDSAAIFAAETARRTATADPPLREPNAAPAGIDLAQADAWLREHSPIVRLARAHAATSAARAREDEPWPDPELQVGPQFAFGDDVAAGRASPFASLALRIPLGERLAAAGDLDRARAEVQRIDSLLTLREQQLALRAEWIALLAARARAGLADETAALAARAHAFAERLVDAGSFGAADAATTALEATLRAGEALDARTELGAAECTVARRTGVDESRFARVQGELPSAPALDVAVERLRDLAALHTPALLRARGGYALAERMLRLEVAKQVPDLELSPSFSDEPGEDKNVFALGIGLRLPLFDGNQKAIREAEAARDEARVAYETAVATTLAELARATRALHDARARRSAAEAELFPTAVRAVELAQRAVQAGEANVLLLVESERALARAKRTVLDAGVYELEAWLALERNLGIPLLDLGTPAPDAIEPPPLDPQTNDEVLRAARATQEDHR